MNKLILVLFLTLSSNIVLGQSKKDLRSTVFRLQADSTALENKLKEKVVAISALNSEISDANDFNNNLKTQIRDVTIEFETSKVRLNDSISRLNVKLDSVNTYYKIIHFVKTFYSSLEPSDEESLRQYEYGDFKFDLENFNALVSNNARYSQGRVKNLSHEKHHDKYFIMLQSIDEIKFSLNKILVKTKVMYSGDNMGLFFNEEQLTLRENKGLIKLTDWVDLDLYKMLPSMEATVENVTREDFYKWIDGESK